MRQRHAAAGIAAFLTMVIGAGAALAGGPTTASGRPDWVQEGTSRTFDLADGARVHTLPLRTDQSASVAPAAAQVGALAGFGIDYHGGPIVPAESVTAIYWSASQIYAGGPQAGTSGNGAADGSLVGYFLRNLGGSPYYNINTTYADTVGGGHLVTNTLGYTQFWADSSGAPSGSATVSDAAIQAEITKGLTSGAVAWNPSTVYAVFSSGAVNLGGGFLSSYCAYHGSFSWGANTVLYAVMPYDNAGPGTCTALAAPNGDAAGDAEVNTLAHELEEANTDPQLNAWWNSATGAENADQCAWNFGTRSLSAGQANITVGAKNFLVQQNWLNANGGLCAQSYSTVVAKDFSITASPTALSIGQGGSGSATIGTAVTSGSSATVNLSVGGAPSGTTASVSPASVSAGASSTLSVVVGSSTAPGTYPLTITGVEGSATHSAIVSLTVTGPAGVPGAATLAATRSSRRGVQLSWTVPASHGSSISAYRIYRGTASGAEALLVQLSGGTTRYRDIATTSGRLYFYRITAVNGYGEGPLSNEASATAR